MFSSSILAFCGPSPARPDSSLLLVCSNAIHPDIGAGIAKSLGVSNPAPVKALPASEALTFRANINPQA